MPEHNEIQIPFFNHRLRREVAELYVASSIQSFAKRMLGLFVPIFLYSIGFTVQQIVLFYLATYFIRFITLPLSGKIATKFGFEHAMGYSVPITILFYASLYFTKFYPGLIFIVPLLFATSVNVYWAAHHADFAYYGKDGQRGREVGTLHGLKQALTVAAPFLGGLILKLSGFNILFLAVSILLFVSIIPLFTTKERFRPRAFSYTDSFKRLFSKKNVKRLFGYMGFGERLVSLAIWPIFIYIVLADYFLVGSLVSFATLITVIAMFYISRLTDKMNRKNIIKTGSVLCCLGWLARLLARFPLYILFMDTFLKISKSTVEIPMFASTYKRAQNGKVMDTIIFYEMGLTLGTTLTALLIYILLFYTSNIAIAFIPAALVSLLYMLL